MQTLVGHHGSQPHREVDLWNRGFSHASKGLLAKISRKKYGHRPDERPRQRNALFERLATKTIPEVLIESDENPHYRGAVKRWFPKCDHQTVKGGRGCVAGQGELKKLGFDPLFTLNHTFAMLRDNISRLVRKTWCTTKKPERLDAHLQLYIHFHNHVLIKQKRPNRAKPLMEASAS